MSERFAALDLFDDDLEPVSVEEINERATRDDHGWNPVVAYDEDANALKRVVVSFDSEDDRREFDRRFGRIGVRDEEDLGAGIFDADAYTGTPTQERYLVEAFGTQEAERSPRNHWLGLPIFVPVSERLGLVVEFGDERERARFFERASIRTVHKGTRGTLSVWWPDRPKEDLSSLRFVSTRGVVPRHPVYVISKGRAETALTPRFLARDGVPFRLVVEPPEANAYRRRFGDVVVELPFSNLGQGSTPARNWCWEDARAAGAERHWVFDDNIGQIRRLYAGKRIPCDAGPAIAAVEAFAERYENVAIAGMNYQMFVTPTSPPFALNCHVYSGLLIRNDLPHRWRLRYNEDTDLCLQVLSAGFATVLVSAVMIDKKTTMTMGGGNTDLLYGGDGRTKMAKSLRALWLDSGLVTVRRRFGRDQHVVDWGAFRTELRPRVDLSALPEFDEFGMTLRKVREPESAALRRLFDEYVVLRSRYSSS